MSKQPATKRTKAAQQQTHPQQPASEAAILDPAQARRAAEQWEARFNYLASRDPIQFKHLHRRVIQSGLSWEEMVDKEGRHVTNSGFAWSKLFR